MQNSAWVALLRHLPPEQHNQFMLVTVSGTEIAVQSLLRIEQELVVVKGRLSGSQEAGRLFFIPDHIDYFGSANPVKDTEFNETFGSLILPDPAAAAEEPGVLASAAGASGLGVAAGIRSEVLDRYRSRPSSAAPLPNAKPNGT